MWYNTDKMEVLIADFTCTVNSFGDGQLGDLQYVPILERCPSYRESNKGSKERWGPTLGVHFTEVSVL